MTLASPLQWPAHLPRTTYRRRAQFQVSLSQARDELYQELGRMGASKVIVSSNARLNLNGTPSAKQPFIADAGVAVYFTRKGQESVIACDRWDSIGDNIRAIGKTVEALRGIERWGTSEMVDAAFTGFSALPAGATGGGWWDVMGLAESAVPRDVIEAQYRRLAKQHHPDVGGDPDVWRAIQGAYEQGMKARSA